MKRVLIAATTVAVVAVVGAVAWLNLVRADGPDEFGLTERSTAASQPVGGATLETLDGTWTVSNGSEAGYRVVEDLRGVKDFEAVGRTEQVKGSITIEATSVTEGSFEIDVATITSDSSQRDSIFSGERIMDTANFPTATFTVTEPADFASIPGPATSVTAQVNGDLTLRDTTLGAVANVAAQIVNGQIELVGTVPVVFEQFGIANPSNAVASVGEAGSIEVKLLLTRS